MRASTEEAAIRVLIETIRLTAAGRTSSISDIGVLAKTSTAMVRKALHMIGGLSEDETVSLNHAQRVLLALEVARAGRLKDSARSLTWQEFESFGGECLLEAGFRVEKNVRVKGGHRIWQIDLIGYRGDLVLTIDCKHWNSSGYGSRLEPQAKHQRLATAHFLKNLVTKASDQRGNLRGLAVILTLLDPPTRFLERAALVSVEQLPSFLNSVTPFDPTLPLMSASRLLVENPMS